jgi:hypothetical protein
MLNRSRPGKPDVNQMAAIPIDAISGDLPVEKQPSDKNKNAVELGRLGGLKGGKARAAKLSAKRRKEIAFKAVKPRWANHNKDTKLDS